ncbi:MAG: hypothetical protein QOG70_2965 [Solirubrobacteraceae bacterium]|jgi:hypothetical protein|nr:hypothetical protein [Solirubrobacteraceae bacterium]
MTEDEIRAALSQRSAKHPEREGHRMVRRAAVLGDDALRPHFDVIEAWALEHGEADELRRSGSSVVIGQAATWSAWTT